MNKALLDTDILSEILRGKNKVVLFREQEYRIEWGVLTFSAVTVMEITYGLQMRNNPRLLARFTSKSAGQEVVAFSSSTAELAGKIAAQLGSAGASIGQSDVMIAATAIEHGLVLVSGNTKHYERIQRLGFPLQLANWREADR